MKKNGYKVLNELLFITSGLSAGSCIPAINLSISEQKIPNHVKYLSK